MPADPKPPLTDEARDQLARSWFAEARTRTREDEEATRCLRPAARAAGDADGGFLDWLFGDNTGDDDACGDSDGGDGGD